MSKGHSRSWSEPHSPTTTAVTIASSSTHPTRFTSTTAVNTPQYVRTPTSAEPKRPAFISTRLKETDPLLSDAVWTKTRDGKKFKRRNYLFFLLGVTLGLLGAIGVIVEGYLTTKRHNYCLVLEDNFDGPLDTSVWKHEIETGGFGNHEFQWTTDSSNNSFVSLTPCRDIDREISN